MGSKTRKCLSARRKKRRLTDALKTYMEEKRKAKESIGHRERTDSESEETNGEEEEGELLGRRIVDIAEFFEQIKHLDSHGPFNCSFRDMKIVRETRAGLRSSFTFKCKMCDTVGTISSETLKDNNMNINRAAVSGTMTTGGGHARLEEMLSIMNIPPISYKTYAKYENQVTKGWMTTAEMDAEEEAWLASEEGEVDKGGTPLITGVADGSWCRQSYPTNCSSLSDVIEADVEQKMDTLDVKQEMDTLDVKQKLDTVVVKQENEIQEPAPECSTSWSLIDDDDDDDGQLEPCLSPCQIFIKQDVHDSPEAEECSVRPDPLLVESKPSICSSTSGTADNGAEVSGLNNDDDDDGHSISSIEKCNHNEPTVTAKKHQVYRCAYCDYKSTKLSYMKKHMNRHKKRTLSCEHCAYTCSRQNDLTKHIRIHTGEKKFSCQFCDYKCSESKILKQHLKVHTGEKHFICEFCAFKSPHRSVFIRHIRTHTGENPFSCEYCAYKCSDSGTLKSHIRKHTGEKPYSCEFCDCRFANSSAFTLHVRIHTGEKPYSCQLCDYQCSASNALTKHMRKHTGEKPYGCEFCDYRSSYPNALKAHVRTHTGEKPYSCEFCEYTCSNSSTMKSHIRTHTGDKPYSCEFCDHTCSHLSALKKHLKIHSLLASSL